MYQKEKTLIAIINHNNSVESEQEGPSHETNLIHNKYIP